MSRRKLSKADYRALQRNSPAGVLEEALR